LWQAAQPLVMPAWLGFVLAVSVFGEPGAIGVTKVGRLGTVELAAVLGDTLFAAAMLGDVAIGAVVADLVASAVTVLGLAPAGAAIVAAEVVVVVDLVAVVGAAVVVAVVGAAIVAEVVVVVVDLVAVVGAAVVVAVVGAATVATVAVVVQPAGELLVEPKLVVLVWQQPQSAVVLGWSPDFPCAPLVPWLVYEPLWQESQRLDVTAVWLIV
jgi:hypothetical protein